MSSSARPRSSSPIRHAATLLLLALAACAGDPPGTAEAPGPDFAGLVWVDGAPDLQGRVTLVRWWTQDDDLCAGSAPALGRLAARAPVVAVYHPRPPRAVTPEEARRHAKAAGMPGILAIDRDWSVLDRWAPPSSRRLTSLTFLLDAQGRIRYVHPGGLIGPEDELHLAQRIEALLTEK